MRGFLFRLSLKKLPEACSGGFGRRKLLNTREKTAPVPRVIICVFLFKKGIDLRSSYLSLKRRTHIP